LAAGPSEFDESATAAIIDAAAVASGLLEGAGASEGLLLQAPEVMPINAPAKSSAL